jgi:hypothetical protein
VLCACFLQLLLQLLAFKLCCCQLLLQACDLLLQGRGCCLLSHCICHLALAAADHLLSFCELLL